MKTTVETEAGLSGRLASCPSCTAVSRVYENRHGGMIECSACEHYRGYDAKEMRMRFDTEEEEDGSQKLPQPSTAAAGR